MYRIKGKHVVVIGAGEVAYRKVKDLIAAGAIVTVIAPHIGKDLSALANDHSVTIIQRLYQKGDCKGAALVFSATNNTEVNQQVFYEASELNIPINAVDDPDNSSFYVPSFFTRGKLLVAVSTGGASPAMAAKVRRLLEQAIPQDIEQALDALTAIRKLLKENFPHLTSNERSTVLKTIANDEHLIARTIASHNNNTLHELLNELLMNKK
ncbi:MAG TPA: bifunctional precorrin-2 dehydrogenase/sirohydrochlorin ferrochelatase [Spirochaetota bacterium]|nr:bifunctional precorrin-2 dehydrogenase/sirohydrochlorin ferrochelatase [Spirochaetota bacterium]HOF12852.1 bifunctional precorrin-2 dehydrogenase/sirohydrochlorin ferrochelatase [Spirochaetota bacterium]HOM87746.1 bifunctional precorrin-2 dehydrogenase/sirohydrochlorin ferrochelatase [Spirochaetota bacterium]HOR93131.1 bifunctional precorrin-2 dehydrogenase/sirohydrochlorin ferrochelatase [Spirochaetota bacterium]HOT19633.1 bifunctional precorrin-2 dehydrogenase/sirohydrochlorin ferrochelata